MSVYEWNVMRFCNPLSRNAFQRPMEILPRCTSAGVGNVDRAQVSLRLTATVYLSPQLTIHRAVCECHPAGPCEEETSPPRGACGRRWRRSEEHTSELQSLMRISYAVLCLKKKKLDNTH